MIGMATRKPLGRKLRRLKREKQNRRVPAWVMQRTNRKFMRHPHQRSWRKTNIKT